MSNRKKTDIYTQIDFSSCQRAGGKRERERGRERKKRLAAKTILVSHKRNILEYEEPDKVCERKREISVLCVDKKSSSTFVLLSSAFLILCTLILHSVK
jgi:hypothetical protein